MILIAPSLFLKEHLKDLRLNVVFGKVVLVPLYDLF